MAQKNLAFAIILLLVVLLVFIIIGLWIQGAEPNIQKTKIENQKQDVESTICSPIRTYILNVGQADSTLIITPSNKTLLIDTGSSAKANSSTEVIEFLIKNNISRIDYLILTHNHEDHIGGLDKIVTNFAIEKVYHNGNCANYSSATERYLQSYTAMHDSVAVTKDMGINTDDNNVTNDDACAALIKIIVAYDRTKGCYDDSDENDNSLLLKIDYGNTSMLFAADCENGCENELMRQGTELKADFLRIGHHGSQTSSSKEFLNRVDAKYYAISVDRSRSVKDGYFHPRLQTLANIYQHEPTALVRTDLNGNIEVDSDGRKISIKPAADVNICEEFSGYNSSNARDYGPVLESCK